MRNNNDLLLVQQRLLLLLLFCLMPLSRLHSNNSYVQASDPDDDGDVEPVVQEVDVVVVGLEQKYAIRGPLSYGHDLLDFSIDFIVSDFIDDDMVGYKIYDGLDCWADEDDEITENSGYLVSELITDNITLVGDGSGERTMSISMSFDPDLIVNSTIYNPYYSNNDTDTDTDTDNDSNNITDTDDTDVIDIDTADRGIVEICLRFSNYNADKDSSNTFEVNFVENPIVIVLDFMGDIDSDFDMEVDMEIAESDILESNTTTGGITLVLFG